MKVFVMAVAGVLAAAAPGWGQALDTRLSLPSMADLSRPIPLLPEPTLGARAGYLRQRDADEGTWFGGVQARLPFAPSFSLEASVEFHATEFSDGDMRVVQYPIQFSALVYLSPGAAYNPYLLAGAGWYYTETGFSGALAALDDEKDNIFGAHVGGGIEVGTGTTLKLNFDVRYIFLEPKSDALEDEEFDTLQFTMALNFPF